MCSIQWLHIRCYRTYGAWHVICIDVDEEHPPSGLGNTIFVALKHPSQFLFHFILGDALNPITLFQKKPSQVALGATTHDIDTSLAMKAEENHVM